MHEPMKIEFPDQTIFQASVTLMRLIERMSFACEITDWFKRIVDVASVLSKHDARLVQCGCNYGVCMYGNIWKHPERTSSWAAIGPWLVFPWRLRESCLCCCPQIRLTAIRSSLWQEAVSKWAFPFFHAVCFSVWKGAKSPAHGSFRET